jgi:hypothetical protein
MDGAPNQRKRRTRAKGTTPNGKNSPGLRGMQRTEEKGNVNSFELDLVQIQDNRILYICNTDAIFVHIWNMLCG